MYGMIGLRFLLSHGAFINVTLLEEEAKKIVERHQKGDTSIIGGTSQFGSWSVRLADVMAIHTFSLQEAMQQKPFNLGKSGIS